MVSSQKVSHVPAEVFQQQYELQESGNNQAEKYQFVSTTEKYVNHRR